MGTSIVGSKCQYYSTLHPQFQHHQQLRAFEVQRERYSESLHPLVLMPVLTGNLSMAIQVDSRKL